VAVLSICFHLFVETLVLHQHRLKQILNEPKMQPAFEAENRNT
jgi:hypothetical protein